MVRKVMAVAVLIVGFATLGVNAFAEDVKLGENVNLGVNCSAVLPKESSAQTGIYVGGILSLGIGKYVALGVESGYLQVDYEEADVKLGSLRAVPLFGDVIVRYPIEAGNFTVAPYALVGTGVLFTDFAESGVVKDAGISVNTETSFAMKFGGGFDLYVTKNIALNFEGSYMIGDIDVSANWRGKTYAVDSFSADAWFLGGGAKVRF